MKKITLILITLFTFIISCKNDEPNPDRFKTGKFEIPEGKGYEKTIIIRQDSIQIEKYENRIDTLLITWKNNFNYTLKMLHPKNAIDEEPIHVKITGLKNNSYEFEAVIGHSNFIQKGTIFKKDN
ncbi:hypothetical protein [Lutibacter sp.]|uniref:hypothetical protein n=1 Tax=Lutibacter sp. TaxID=1925666 RepID=UPI0025C5934E|nr:hypothetical protein [Lutibacter sp.]MCF6167434.1 hypothetical protein [Lutibacter sp.]